MILGVEVREDAVLAVAADDAGAITRRGKHDGAAGSSAVEAVRAALGGGRATAIGVAVRDRVEKKPASIFIDAGTSFRLVVTANAGS